VTLTLDPDECRSVGEMSLISSLCKESIQIQMRLGPRTCRCEFNFQAYSAEGDTSPRPYEASQCCAHAPWPDSSGGQRRDKRRAGWRLTQLATQCSGYPYAVFRRNDTLHDVSPEVS